MKPLTEGRLFQSKDILPTLAKRSIHEITQADLLRQSGKAGRTKTASGQGKMKP